VRSDFESPLKGNNICKREQDHEYINMGIEWRCLLESGYFSTHEEDSDFLVYKLDYTSPRKIHRAN
jgi:hypothetical protein